MTEKHEQQFVFNGVVHARSDKTLSVRLFPGLILDLNSEDIDQLDEATDPVTNRAYVCVRLKPDANISANFQPRLARLAAAAEAAPFALGGTRCDNDVVSIVPPLDVAGVAAFANRLAPGAWGALRDAARAQGVALAAEKTNTRCEVDTKYVTRETGEQDTRKDIKPDDTKDDDGW